MARVGFGAECAWARRALTDYPRPERENLVLAIMTRVLLNIGLAIGLVSAALQIGPTIGHAEMIRPGEAHLEDLAPPGAFAPAPLAQTDPDAHKGWVGPFITLGPAPTPRSRAQALAAARLSLGGSAPEPHSIAVLAAGGTPDRLTQDLRIWLAARAGDSLDWPDLDGFLQRRGDWPALARLQVQAERRMPADLPAAERLAFFEGRQPRTARGARLMGEALIELGRKEAGETRIAEAWRTLAADSAEEKIYLKKHGALLEPHHTARYELLIWRKRLTAARRLAKKKLSKGFVQLAEALQALHRAGRGVDGKIKRVPAGLRDHPSLTHARMIWRARKRRHKDAENALLEADKSGELGAAGAWARWRARYARDAYEDGRHGDAAALAAAHQLEAGVDFADLEWFAGWMRLGRLDDPQAALRHFTTLWRGVKTPISRSRAAFWAGQAAEAAGDRAAAQAWWERASDYSSAFYGQLAAEKIGEHPIVDAAEEQAAAFDPDRLSPMERSTVAAADLLYAAGMRREGRLFMKTLAAGRSDPAGLRWLALRARGHGDLAAEIEVAKRAFEIGEPLWSSLFPIPATPRFAGRRVEPALLLAVARQESRFMRFAKSSAGAVGLMQMMPATAKASARKLKVPFERDRLTEDWAYNLSLSDAHLHGVLERYNGSYVLSVAAYNAGEGNVDKWIKRFGDPRDASVDVITWIESIPFAETRNYVQRVLEAAQIYRMRLGGADYLTLMADLER